MKFNYQFPARAVGAWDVWIGEKDLAEMALVAEQSGFESISATDHPFPSTNWVDNGGHHAFDPFVALSFMAAATERIRLMTFILVAGYRNPFLAAKSVASLDVLSGGRVVVGMGAGYEAGEFDALGAEFAGRGVRFDEAIIAMREAWRGESVYRDGPHFPAHGNVMLPRPAQRPGPPVWIGGNSRAAQRRVRDLGDGWLPFEQTSAMSSVTGTPQLVLDGLREQIDGLRAARVERGRDADFAVLFTPQLRGEAEGRAHILADLVPRLEEAGVTHVSVESRGVSMDACLQEIDLIGSQLGLSALGPKGSRRH